MSRNEKKIRDVCAKHNVYVGTLRWESLGKDMEMCGREGGWNLNTFNPIGHSTADAIDFIERFHESLESVEEHDDEDEEIVMEQADVSAH